MTADSSALDPYRSPSLPEGPFAGKAPSGKPGWLTALCVICIVLGALGLMNTVFGTVGMLAGPSLQTMFQPKGTPGVPADLEKANQQFQSDMLDIQRKHLAAIVVTLVFRFVAALLLLIGGMRCLGLKESGRKTLITACAVAMIFELIHTIVQSVLMMDSLTAMNGFAERLQSSMPSNNAPPGFNGFLKWWFQGIMIFQIVVIYTLALLKLALFLFGITYLQKPHIKALFK